MAASTFDTLRIARALKDAGFDDAQSEAIVFAIQTSLGENVATKSDLNELRADIYRAMWVLGAGLVGLVMINTAITSLAVALIKLT